MNLSIIICTYNRSKLLRGCLESLERVKVPDGLSWEILVIDNHSTDHTELAVKDFADKASVNVKYLFERTQGKSFALNRGIKEAKGEIVAFLDDDMTVDKSWLEAVIEAIRQYPEAEGFGGRVLISWPIPKPSWVITEGPYKNIDGTVGYRDCGDADEDFLRLKSLPTGGNMFFRKSVFANGHSFREDLGPAGQKMGFGEDREFCLKVLSQGKKLFYISKAIAYHHIPETKLSKKYFCRRRFDCAYSDVKHGIMRSHSSGIPRYLFRYLFSHFIHWLFSLDHNKRFSYQLKLYSVLGQIAGYRSRKKLDHEKGGQTRVEHRAFPAFVSRFRYQLELGAAYYVNSVAWHLWRKRYFSEEWQNKNYRWIFIMGCNDSGTSLLYNILGEHPQIGKIASESVNESRFFPSFISNVLPSLKLGVDRAWSERRDIFRLTEKYNHLDENRLRYDWLNFVKIKNRDSKPYLIEKTTENALRSRWLQKVFPNSYFIGIVRNGYAVSEGLRRNSGYHIERCARHWNNVNKTMLEDSRYLRNFKLVTYEDLTGQPEKALFEIAEFLGLDKEPFLELAKQNWNTQNIFNSSMSKSMPIQNMNEPSLKRLSSEDIEMVNQEASEMLKDFSYFIQNLAASKSQAS
jgi:glycosyltransferase involved in cell wall biosynthesis